MNKFISTTILLIVMLFVSVTVQAQTSPFPPSGGGAGAGAIACSGTPGNTTGSYRQQCQTGTGAVFACNNASGCTVAADWVAAVAGTVRAGLISGLPATCNVGDVYFATDAAAGANIYQCTATDIWSPPVSGSGSTSYSQSFTSQTSVTLTHNLGTVAVEVQCFDSGSPPQKIETNTEQASTTNSYTVTFSVAQSGSCVVLSGSGGVGPTGPAGAPGGTPPGALYNTPLTGLGLEYVSGLTYTVGAGTYLIGGTQYASAQTPITLATADPTNPRIDVIYVDNNSSVQVLTGTPAATPSQPSVDYSTELPLNVALIPAGGSAPTGVSTTLIYDENVEWTCSSTTHINCASTNNPYHGTKDIEATAAVLGNSFTLVKPASGTTDLSTLNSLVCYIDPKAKWPSGSGTGSSALRTLSLFWLNGATQVGLQVVIRDGAFNFNSATPSYQQISIPLGPTGPFGTGSNLVTSLKGQITGNGGTSSIGFYVDQCSLQGGTGAVTLPITSMNFKGNWASTASYNTNDVVISSNCGYVALTNNTNVNPSNTSTWQNLCSGVVPITTGTTSITLSGPTAIGICPGGGACNVAVPVPVKGAMYCAWNDDNVSTTITFTALGSSARYENQARTAYGTAGTGTLSSAGAVGDKACIVGIDSTHYQTINASGTWTAS